MNEYHVCKIQNNLVLYVKSNDLTTTYFNSAAVKKINRLLHTDFREGKVTKKGDTFISETGDTFIVTDKFEVLETMKTIERKENMRTVRNVVIGTAATVALGTIIAFALKHKVKEEPIETTSTIIDLPDVGSGMEEIINNSKRQEIIDIIKEAQRRYEEEKQIVEEPTPTVETVGTEASTNSNDIVVELAVSSTYDEELETKVSRYDSMIKDASTRWGVSESIIRDIMKQESSGGDYVNMMQVEKKAWLDQEIVCYDYIEHRETSFVLTEHPEDHENIENVYTLEMLDDPQINVTYGTNVFKWCYVNSKCNFPEAVQMFNFGYGKMMNIVLPAAAKDQGMTVEELLLDEGNTSFMNYLDLVESNYGDHEYLYNVMKHSTKNFNLDDGKKYDMKYIDKDGTIKYKSYLVKSDELNKNKERH